ncbi:hypothetical protein SeMB42_g04527 [Synchytrium endobioticum]|uniref:Uncharacterized protein n=1 Tax=Synchytrium endobioticum TaxID=286115 RepID=A0A507CXL9_9FUNG|nr:hypothetical protein SeMB42_g04527 [Synchytrium endobioticum]TPX45611.1 hypothetical protein SeLEV6574_g03783 [Synchytrium endobioticum]
MQTQALAQMEQMPEHLQSGHEAAQPQALLTPPAALSTRIDKVELALHRAMGALSALKDGLQPNGGQVLKENLSKHLQPKEPAASPASMQDPLTHLGDLSQRMNWSPLDNLLPSKQSNQDILPQTDAPAVPPKSPESVKVSPRVKKDLMLGGHFDYDAAQKVLMELSKLRRDMMLPMYNRFDLAIPVKDAVASRTATDTIDDILRSDRVQGQVRRRIDELAREKSPPRDNQPLPSEILNLPSLQQSMAQYQQLPILHHPSYQPPPLSQPKRAKAQTAPMGKNKNNKRHREPFPTKSMPDQQRRSPMRNSSHNPNVHRTPSPGHSFSAPSQRPSSPLRPPNFYNVRLSNMPIFLRRTSVRPPTLGFLDNLPPPKSPTKKVPCNRSLTVTTHQPLSPAAVPPKLIDKLSPLQVFDEATQTSSIRMMVTHATQVTHDTSSHIELAPPKPVTKEFQTIGVQSDPPLQDTGVQYDTPAVSEAVQTDKPSPKLPERVQSEVLLRILQKATAIKTEPRPQIPESAFILVRDSIINEIVDENIANLGRECRKEAQDMEHQRSRLEAAEKYRQELLETEEMLRRLREAAEQGIQSRKVDVQVQAEPQPTSPLAIPHLPSESFGPGLTTLSTVMSEGEVLTNLYSEGEIVERFAVGGFEAMIAAAEGRDMDATSADLLTHVSDVECQRQL